MSGRDDRWEASAERWLGMAGGIAFGVLTLAGWALWAGPHLPELNATPARIGAWYAQHQGAARAGALLGVVALLPFMGFVVALYQRLRAAEGGRGTFSLVALLGGVMVCVVHFLFLSFLYVAAFRPRVVSPDVTTTLHNLGVQGGPASVLFATLLGGAAVVVLRYGALPRWVGYFAVAAAILQLAYLPGIPFTDSGLFDPTDGLLGVYADFGSFLTWCIAAGIAMSRIPAVAPPVASTAARDVRSVTPARGVPAGV
jgi:hypothetical protein